nr:hypothetical protein I308_00755 [Cryptococcus tetragattii IND107]
MTTLSPPPPRSVQTIKASLEQQLDLAMQGGTVDAIKKLKAEKKAKMRSTRSCEIGLTSSQA